MSYEDDESGVESSQPREGLEIKHGETTYRIATGSRDVVLNGNLYTAQPGERDRVAVTLLKQDRDLVVRLPVSHAFTQRYHRGGNPPRLITCAIYRLQPNSGEVRRIYQGLIESCSIDGHVATFTVASAALRAMRRKLPVITVGRKCPYILYGAGCRVLRASHRVITTVAGHSGRTVTLASIGGNPDQWAQGGELVHIPSGERATISAQVGTLVTLQLQITDLAVGHAVHVFAGCAHTVASCRDKFDNLSNYGGVPELPRGNIFLPNGFGIYTSE